MDNKKAQQLLDKYLAGKCTPAEKQLIESWYTKVAASQPELDQPADYDKIGQQIFSKLPVHKQIKRRLWLPYAAAALVIFTLGTGLFFYFYKGSGSSVHYANDVKPGSNKAILTLANGAHIELNSAKKGNLASQGQTNIVKTGDGRLEYNGKTNTSASETAYNTISTPRGGQYMIILGDGSKVYLNAASSLKYPVAFTGSKRQVELRGEAYFEVAHNKAMPFIVKTDKEQVQVLGTHFNINSYPDEAATTTTLLEGSVKVNSASANAMLVPGEQSVIANADDQVKVKQADIEDVMAWKNGDFVFKEESLASIMRKVSRWYDVDVVYNSAASQNATFGGWVSRGKNISAVLKIMELTGKVHFKVEGRRITVM